jgi:hypothetical protein
VSLRRRIGALGFMSTVSFWLFVPLQQLPRHHLGLPAPTGAAPQRRPPVILP